MNPKMRMLLVACATLMLTLFAGAAMAAQNVLCFSCPRPPNGGACSFKGRVGTWGADQVIGGVTFHVCVLPIVRIVPIPPTNAFTNRQQAINFVETATVKQAGLHSPQKDCKAAIADYSTKFQSDARLQSLCTAKRPSTKPVSIVQIDCVPGTPSNGFNTGSVISVIVECK